MSINAHNFVAEKLAEVVEDKHRRQKMMVNSFTVFGLFFLVYACFRSFINQDVTLGSVLSAFTLFSFFNVFVMLKNRELGVIGLTCIIYSLSFYLIFSGGYQNTGFLWVYLLAPIAIFINKFKTGFYLSFGFLCTLAILLSTRDMHQLLPGFYTSELTSRFVLTIFALSGMCHILIYFQAKADDYIVKMHDEDILQLAYFDSLTMLSNRVTFRSILYHSVQKSSSPVCGLIFIDLDNFKSINDEYGHDQGDAVLADFANVLKYTAIKHIGADKIGKYDVSRLGGDEFAIYIEDATDKSMVLALADEVLAAFNQKSMKSLVGLHHDLGASAGIVFASFTGRDLIAAMSMADKAMYAAKSSGKGQYKIVEV